MKKWFALGMALLLMAASIAALAETADDPYCGRWQDPYYGRALLEITAGDDGCYDITITWGNSADSQSVWRMNAALEDGSLVYTDGVMAIETYGEGGALIDEDVQWDDAEGAFTLSDDGKLLWRDSREERSGEFALEKLEYEVE